MNGAQQIGAFLRQRGTQAANREWGELVRNPSTRPRAAPTDYELLEGLPEPLLKAMAEQLGDSLADRPAANALSCGLGELLAEQTEVDWLLEDTLERGVIALLAGPRASFKSFLALDWSMRVALSGQPVYVISAEGGDYDRRAAAWLKEHAPGIDPTEAPLRVVQRRIDLNAREPIDDIRRECQTLGIRPALIILDTLSKLSGGLEENDNTEVKQFIGRLDNGFKRADTGFGATVLLIAHTGHSDKSRARGASALGADTDAEYIVSRDDRGTVCVTRERFKSSPELPPVFFRPRVVDIGRLDKRGLAVTSVVLDAVQPEPTRPAGKPLPPNLEIVCKAARELDADGVKLTDAEVIDRALTLKAHDAKGNSTTAQLRQRLAGSLTSCLARGLLHRKPRTKDGLSLTRIVEVSPGEF